MFSGYNKIWVKIFLPIFTKKGNKIFLSLQISTKIKFICINVN